MELYYNGTVYTMKNEGERAAAVLVKDGVIVELFDDVPAGLEAEYIDLQGRTMFPGFTDTHIHLVGTGLALKGINFKEDTSLETIKEKIRTADRQTAEGWIVCEGYNDNQLDGRLTRDMLDELTNRTIIVKRVCRHAAVVNSAALAALGIDETVEDMHGGRFERTDGKLNGWVHDQAMDMFVDASVHETVESLSEHMAVAADALHAAGLTCVHTEDLSYYHDFRNVFQAYQQVFGKGKKQLRLNLLRHTAIFEEMAAAEYEETKWYQFDAMKFYADGALGGRTALFSEPYTDDPATMGLALYSQDELEAQVQKARAYGANIAVHMIGDKACEMVLDAIERYPAAEGRDRLIHVSFLNERLIERMTELPVICDVQPAFMTSDYPWAIDRVGEARAAYSYAWKSLLDAGIVIGGGSDSPIEDYHPLNGIDAAVNRRPFNGSEQYNMKEALSVYDALRLYTSLAADVGSRPYNGVIKAGNYADFTVLTEDPFKVDPLNIHQIEVAMTIVDGDIVYKK